MAAQRDDQAIGARDLVVVQLGDDIALLDAGLCGGTVLNDARHVRAAIGAESRALPPGHGHRLVRRRPSSQALRDRCPHRHQIGSIAP